jgi:hypothetical protein
VVGGVELPLQNIEERALLIDEPPGGSHTGGTGVAGVQRLVQALVVVPGRLILPVARRAARAYHMVTATAPIPVGGRVVILACREYGRSS